jgi:cellulose synthase/poly-beta-1,6-N-acetylglucosamine synthase-like glycosyltransferase
LVSPVPSPPLRLLNPLPPVPLAGPVPDARALDLIGVEFALAHGVLPLRTCGAITPIACHADTDRQAVRGLIEPALGHIAFTEYSEPEIRARILDQRAVHLARRAETRTAPRDSCRDWSGRRTAAHLLILALGIAALAVYRPGAALLLFTLWASVTLVAVTTLRTLAALVEFRNARHRMQNWSSTRQPPADTASLPHISILVPLFDERDIAGRLVKRLQSITYPTDKLEICLILEAGDHVTETALQAADLPPEMKLVTVPRGPLRTKPRAMNYALDFARGDIIGIYDAEDAPAPDQLLKVADAFRTAGPDVACLQGVLDFYNAPQSWLTRCFTIDYATWFRLVLPGLARMGMIVPLGGTTLFFRRSVLEEIGRWDAHNVTEDADLGIRLARRGYRTEFIASVTEEEATASVPAWIRQRSRWIKGYALTWAVHMRDPLRLWDELGAKRFVGFQILFLGTLSQFVLAPLLWSFWLVLFGLPHPITAIAPWGLIVTLGALFLLSEVATLAIAALAVATPKHRWLIKWVPVMHLYFPLAAIASWKGYCELVTRPFFWDKTAHGRPVTRRRGNRFARLRSRPA